MAKLHCVGIQAIYGNDRKFDTVVTNSHPFTDEQVLWIAYSYAVQSVSGRLPESWQTFVWDDSQDWREIVHVPSESVVEYAGSDYYLSAGNQWPAMAIEATQLFQEENNKLQAMLSAYIRAEMRRKYGEFNASKLPEHMSLNVGQLALLKIIGGL